MRRLLLAILLSGMAACGDGGLALDRLSQGEHGRVVDVRSGEVMVLDSGLVVRLAGIATPFPEDPGGDVARDALTKLVKGKTIDLLYGGKRRDDQQRALAQVRLSDSRTWVQGDLLRGGYAEVRTWADNRAMADPMLDDEARGRAAKAGLWGRGVFQVRLPREIDRSAQGYQIVEGAVLAVHPTWRGTYLEFTRDPYGFAARVDPRAMPDLEAAGIYVGDLVGRLARVRGDVAWNGVMAVDHPEQIEVLKTK